MRSHLKCAFRLGVVETLKDIAVGKNDRPFQRGHSCMLSVETRNFFILWESKGTPLPLEMVVNKAFSKAFPAKVA